MACMVIISVKQNLIAHCPSTRCPKGCWAFPFQFIKGFVHINQDDIKVENALLWRKGVGGGGGCSMFMALFQIDKEPKENNETSKEVNAWVKSIKTKEMLTFIQYDVHCSTGN